jgi:exonuclease VII small subunit
MKFSLKKLKDIVKRRMESDDVDIEPSFEEWLEGFEKELRERYESSKQLGVPLILEFTLKEILGE